MQSRRKAQLGRRSLVQPSTPTTPRQQEQRFVRSQIRRYLFITRKKPPTLSLRVLSQLDREESPSSARSHIDASLTLSCVHLYHFVLYDFTFF